MSASSEDIYEKTLTVFEHTGNPNEPLTSTEVADALDRSRRTVYKRLQTLVDRGELRTKKVGSSGRVWWLPSLPIDAEEGNSLSGTAMSRYQRLVEETLVGICIIQDGVVKYVNPTFTDMLGYTPEEAIGEQVLEFVAEDERDLVAEHVRQREHGEIDVIRYEGRGKHADGTVIDVEIHGDLIEYGGEPAILGTLVDMTERKQRERELEESERRYRTLAEHFPNGVVALFDHDLRYTLAAGTVAEGRDFSPGNLEGRRVGETATEISDLLEEHCRAALSGEKRTFEFEQEGRVLEAWTLPVRDETGAVFAGMMMTQDITDHVERERELEDYRTVVENVRDGVYMTDADRRFTMINETYCELIGYSREELLGEHVSLVLDEETTAKSVGLIRDLREGESEVATTEDHHYTPDGQGIPVENRFTLRPTDDGAFQGTAGVVRDITDRLERERELRNQRDRYRRLVEVSPAPIIIYTADGTIAYVNDAATERFAVDTAEDLLGEPAIEFVHPDDRPEAVERMRQVIDGREATSAKETKLIDTDGRIRHTIITSTPVMHEGQPASQVVINDITERKQRERELERYETIVETVNDGVYTVDDAGRFTMVNEAYAEMVGYSRAELVGEHVSLVTDETAVATGQELGRKMEKGTCEKPTLEADLRRSDGETITAEATFSLLPGETHERVGVVRDVTERKEQERKLDQQRQELAALNHLQAVALNVIDLVVEQSTREEMKREVCERLAASNVYDFAWIGHVTRSGRELTVTAASDAADELAGVTAPLDENEPTEGDLIARAATTQSLQFSQTGFEDPAYERWCEDGGSHSGIAVPITHKGRRYGVLTLYTERSSEIGTTERSIIQQLAEVVGHAITALERGKSLLADRAIEVEYRSTALAEPLVEKADGDPQFTIDRTIPVDDDFLQYYTLKGVTADECVELVEALPSAKNVRVLFEGEDYVRVEARTTGETMASLFTTFDGRTTTTEITDGEVRVVGELPETANVREVTEAVTKFYPGMEFVGQRHVMRKQVPLGQFRTVIQDALTDRQRTVLETACYAGFFDWPRESSGEDVADSLGISSSTFHQHLRKAEKKLIDVVFADL